MGGLDLLEQHAQPPNIESVAEHSAQALTGHDVNNPSGGQLAATAQLVVALTQ